MGERIDIPLTDRILGLIKLGYEQVSARYRIVARLPEGKTGRDALYGAKMAQLAEHNLDEEMIAYWRTEHREWVNRLGEESSAGHFRRVHARAADLWLELTEEEFREFKAQRGRTA